MRFTLNVNRSQERACKDENVKFEHVFRVFEEIKAKQKIGTITFKNFICHYHLLEASNMPHQIISKGKTLLHMVSESGHLYLFRHMRERLTKANINLVDKSGYTPLQHALNSGNPELVDVLLREFKTTVSFAKYTNNRTLLHPLLLAMKKQYLEVALRILSMIRQEKQKQSSLMAGATTTNPRLDLDLNLHDSQRNTLLHFLFQNFHANMEQSVEFCQELFSLSDKCRVALRINEPNCKGMTPLDQAIELKQNQALEYAIYFNKNLASKACGKRFDFNSNFGNKGFTPLHRAILN